MKHKKIAYPADYRNDPNLKREHRTGVILVWVLVALIVIGSVTCAVLSAKGVRLMRTACFAKEIVDTLIPNSESATPAPAATEAPKAAQIEATPAPTHVPDPDFMDDAAQPFADTFASLPDVIEAVAPGVVGVSNWRTYDRTNTQVEMSSGSGFLITTDGYILTNAHIIEDAERVTVRLSTGETKDAVVVGSDRTNDIAVLKVEAEGLIALPKGDSDAVRVGEFVFAIGDPVKTELAGSVTFGIVSAKSRAINIDGFTNNYIQTDAAINFGSSGGPLIDMNGNVIGMTSAKTVTAGYDGNGNTVSAEGIGFALPINHVWEIASQLIVSGSIAKPGIGITIAQANPMYVAEDEEMRPYVASVTAGGPADLAGVQVGDVVLKVDGKEYTDYDQIVAYIREQTTVGQQIALTVERAGEVLELTVTVGDLNRMP